MLPLGQRRGKRGSNGEIRKIMCAKAKAAAVLNYQFPNFTIPQLNPVTSVTSRQTFPATAFVLPVII